MIIGVGILCSWRVLSCGEVNCNGGNSSSKVDEEGLNIKHGIGCGGFGGAISGVGEGLHGEGTVNLGCGLSFFFEVSEYST